VRAQIVMRILVFGATGGTGKLLVEKALSAGHKVTAFTRAGSPLNSRDGLSIVGGSVFDPIAVAAAVSGHDVVLSALGGRPWRNTRICSSAMRSIVPAMKQHGVRRLLAISTFGANETRAELGWFARHTLFGFLLRNEVADKEAMEDLLSETDLDWTIVRVGILSDGPSRGQFRAKDDRSIRGMGRIARSDVADFMLAQVESELWKWRKPVLVY